MARSRYVWFAHDGDARPVLKIVETPGQVLMVYGRTPVHMTIQQSREYIRHGKPEIAPEGWSGLVVTLLYTQREPDDSSKEIARTLGVAEADLHGSYIHHESLVSKDGRALYGLPRIWIHLARPYDPDPESEHGRVTFTAPAASFLPSLWLASPDVAAELGSPAAIETDLGTIVFDLDNAMIGQQEASPEFY